MKWTSGSTSEKLRLKAVQIKENRAKTEIGITPIHVNREQMRVIPNTRSTYSLPDISNADFSTSKNDHVSAATRL